MGWENRQWDHRQWDHRPWDHRPWARRTEAGPNRPARGLNAAAAVFTGQLPVAWLIWWIGEQSGDDYGIGFNTLGIVCILLFAPLVLPVIGLVHAVVHTGTAGLVAHLASARARGPFWAWHLACSVLLGVGWAALIAALWDWPLTVTAPLFAALGVLPVLGAAYVRERSQWRFWGIWLGSGLASVALFLLVLAGGVLASVAGLLKEYEPPVLSAGQLAGVWRGHDDSELRLLADGRAELTELPARAGGWDYDRCDGTGTWSLVRKQPDGWDRDAVALRLDGGCGQETYWTIGGSEREPELFVLIGDPDAADLHILTPHRPR
ncbi:hypothetical protein AB0I00_16930 [Streptomyces sp. NPDC050803]|uniref:hypothetical protein n=1 Tax=unclassified Streptomyces TaxID=2593676 RepID=UPI00342AFE02